MREISGEHNNELVTGSQLQQTGNFELLTSFPACLCFSLLCTILLSKSFVYLVAIVDGIWKLGKKMFNFVKRLL